MLFHTTHRDIDDALIRVQRDAERRESPWRRLRIDRLANPDPFRRSHRGGCGVEAVRERLAVDMQSVGQLKAHVQRIGDFQLHILAGEESRDLRLTGAARGIR